jgi:hypothetical protein
MVRLCSKATVLPLATTERFLFKINFGESISGKFFTTMITYCFLWGRKIILTYIKRRDGDNKRPEVLLKYLWAERKYGKSKKEL